MLEKNNSLKTYAIDLIIKQSIKISSRIQNTDGFI
jgi:hypothetical protein